MFLSCQGVWAQSAQRALPKVEIRQQLNAQVPLDLTFHNEAGERVQLRDLMDGRPAILSLVYYRCPMLCNVVMDGAVRSLQALRLKPEEYSFITVSIDPGETSELAAASKRTAIKRLGRNGAEKRWHFLTAMDEESVKQLAESVGFDYRYDPISKQYAHGAGLIILTPQGRVSRYFLGVEYPPRDLKLSLVEASDNRIGSLSDQVLLLCYQYDPMTGKYGLVIHQLLRGAGILTVVILGGGVGGLLWRERRQHAKGKRGAAE